MFAFFTSPIALRIASFRERAARENDRKTRPDRMLIVASSQPASKSASSCSWLSSLTPVSARTKSCSCSHGIPVSVVIVLFSGWWLIRFVRAGVDVTPHMTSVILGVPRG